MFQVNVKINIFIFTQSLLNEKRIIIYTKLYIKNLSFIEIVVFVYKTEPRL